MDEYQHMERFGTENDFQDGQWIGDEFYYSKRINKHGQTKDEALYGIFDESDSDDESRRKRRRGGDIVKKNDFSKPVNFVSTGNVKPTEEVDKLVEEDDGAQDRPGLGSTTPGLGSATPGLGSATPGLGSTRPGLGSTRPGLGSVKAMAMDEPEVVEDLFPTAFGRQIVEAAERRQKEKEQEQKQKQKEASKSKGGFDGSRKGVSDVGASFEKHTRGIGMKLLASMGYKGGGLGKNEQGIAAPIEAKLRPQKMGMGFNDFKETSVSVDASARRAEDTRKEKIAEVKQKPQEKLWQAKNRNKKKKEYRTAQELLAEKQGAEVGQTVLDMRGPQVKVLTNLENLNAETETEKDDTPMPELKHNIKLIIDLAEAEIQVCDRKLAYERDTAVIKLKEKERLEKDAVNQKQQVVVLEAITNSLQKIQETIAAAGAGPGAAGNLEAVARSFASIQAKYREEYELYSLGIIGLSFVMPHFVAMFRGWDPLQHPLHGIEVISMWRRLLQSNDSQDYLIFPSADSIYGSNSPYSQLVMEAIIPAVRMSTTNVWEPRDPEPMLRFLEAWEKVLPSSVMQYISESLVMPKLTAAVDAWDPQRETVPIHAWLHPWLPLLGSRMETLYPPIQYKLTAALQAWLPNDSSALTLLSPWQAVFDAASWEQLVVRSIVPKLIYALQDLVINPAHQQLDQFNWVMAWATAVPIHHMTGMLEAYFFPKWQQMLYQWLCHNPNYDEVTRWFLGWKSLFPDELLAHERIRQYFNGALDMMNQAVEGAKLVQPGAQENLSYIRATEQRQFEAQQAAYQQQSIPTSHGMDNFGAENMTLKEAVEIFAANNDVQFMPKGRSYEGLQVFGFGAVSICIDSAKETLLAQAGDRWTPVSLVQLLEMNRHRGGGRWN